MYVPSQFAENRIEVMQAFIRDYPLATIVTISSMGLDANHIPLHWQSDDSLHGRLVGHVARANPLWRDVNDDFDVLVIFQGPNSYITPSWYATKQETGKVVPTWNYAVVHAYGTLRIIDDAVWVRAQLEELTRHNEASLQAPWAVTYAPHDFTKKLIGEIIGIEIPITKLIGKWKVSQNQPQKNRVGVIAGLNDATSADALAMAVLVSEYGSTD